MSEKEPLGLTSVQMNPGDDHRRALALLARRPDCRTEVECYGMDSRASC
jgi:hypothetical protein